MILITGGMYQGKRDFAAAEFGLTDADFRDAGGETALDFSGRAIDHLEQFVLACTRAGVSAQEYLKEPNGLMTSRTARFMQERFSSDIKARCPKIM